jgi:thiamine-phosphate pyrophosphorylase
VSSERPQGLYALADGEALGGVEKVAVAVRRLAQAGVVHIQWRVKQASDRQRWQSLSEAIPGLSGTAAALWVDDRVDLSLAQPSFGVHLGQRDVAPRDARLVVGAGRKIGQSTHDRAQVEAAAADPAVDWIAVGPVFATRSKAEPDPVVGTELVRYARACSPKPLVAIGGIDAGNARSVLDAGADMVAVLSAVCVGDVERNVAQLLEAIA